MTRLVRYLATAAATVLLATAAACGKASTPAGSGPTNSASPSTPAASPSPTPPTSTLQVQLSEFKIVLPTATLTPGQETFAITNVGTITHELLVFRPDVAPAQFPLTADGRINEDASAMHLLSDGDDVDPGKSQTRTVDLSAPGTYLLVCNLPGHFKAGMFTVVTAK
jgi:uncharacterized cupredoxin-like copper-binding protein